MPDITMCKGIGPAFNNKGDPDDVIVCPNRSLCYRYNATPSKHRQAYFDGVPYNIDKNNCKHFLTIID